jgi:L-alanine-DL-glutamate epimerase-like enolase superfamily enzyme
MRIARVQASYLANIPVAPPPLLSQPDRASVIVVAIETVEGLVGHGMTASLMPHAVVGFVNGMVRDELEGTDAWAHERLWRQLSMRFNRRGHTGVWFSAVSAIDTAIWDIRGKAAGVPVATLLGGNRESADCYVTFGLDSYDLDGLAAAARHWVGEGFDRLKMKVGGRTPDDDATRVAAVRDAVGPSVELMLDANRSLLFHHALALCMLVEPIGIAWFEEPLIDNDERLLADLRRQTGIPLAAGQHEAPRQRYRELLDRHAVDVLQLNVANCGGYTEALKICALADTYRIPVANGGGWPYHNLHLQAAVPNGTSVELLQPHLALHRAVCDVLPKASAGLLYVPPSPGLGFAPRTDVITDHSVAM